MLASDGANFLALMEEEIFFCHSRFLQQHFGQLEARVFQEPGASGEPQKVSRGRQEVGGVEGAEGCQTEVRVHRRYRQQILRNFCYEWS